MAKYKQLEGVETEAVAAERSDVVNSTSSFSRMKTVSVDRVMFGDRAVEIPTIEINHVALGRPVDKRYEHNLNMVLSRLRDVGVHVATVVNFRPHELVTCSTIDGMRKTKIPCPKDGEEYGFKIFHQVAIEPARLGADSPLIAVDHHPITLAKTFVAEYEVIGGGVFAFVGLPEDIQNPNWIHRQAFDAARLAAVTWMQGDVKTATSFWNTKDHRESFKIEDHHRFSARRLKHLGYIAAFPEWVEKQRDLAVKVPTCPKCQRSSEPNSAVCTNDNCNYIIDPRRAFEIGDIDETHSALERLNRADVEAMSISDYVAECADEKVERLKAKMPKPMSKVAYFALKQQEAANQQAQGKNAHA
jgi:hypothetical protein